MQTLSAFLILIAFGLPALAQDTKKPDARGGFLDRLEDLAEPLIPLLRDLRARIEDMPGYFPPETLPNGDIIIRRRPDPQAAPTPDTKPEIAPPAGIIEL